jgi:hypothetical protein
VAWRGIIVSRAAALCQMGCGDDDDDDDDDDSSGE